MKDLKTWGIFIALSAIWGSSYLFIKIAGHDLQPFTLVAVRLGLGALGLWGLMAVMRLSPPRDLPTLLKTALLGLLNTTLPFVLIAWAERSIDSGMAAVLNASVPLFALVIAHFALHDERITWLRFAGLAAGFVGVAVTFSENLGGNETMAALGGQIATVLAAVCYAGATVFARRSLSHLHPTVAATMQVTTAFIFTLIGALAVEMPLSLTMSADTVFSIVWLGLLGTCLAYYLYFMLIARWGATRTTLVTYVLPVVSVVLGAVVLGERIGWQLVVGFVLIVGGIALVNLRRTPAPAPIAAPEPADS
jgi:drug/metabolite transporter (DMT)-like permease